MLNTLTNNRYYQTLEAIINTRMHQTCKQPMSRWQQERREREPRSNSFIVNTMKISLESNNFHTCLQEAQRRNRSCVRSQRMRSWITCLMSLLWWCFTVSILINLEISLLNSKPRTTIYLIMKSSLRFFWLTVSQLILNTLLKTWLRQGS